MQFVHKPVLARECIEGLNIKPDGIYVDGTLGGAGHSLLILEKLTGGRLIGFDKDGEALAAAKERLAGYADKVTYVHKDFKTFTATLDELGVGEVDGVLLDLGVSSYQLDNAERGMSYNAEGPLDMRMDKEQSFTAMDVVNGYGEKQLADVIYEYGEERLSRKIAAAIVKRRVNNPYKTTSELAETVIACYPPKERYKGRSLCKRTFQAIRIEVNGELDGLYDTVVAAARRLKKGGRICVITFHSLEDRIVKRAFAYLYSDCVCPPHQPICTCDKKREIEIITRKPVTASAGELDENKRSASAKLRIAEKL